MIEAYFVIETVLVAAITFFAFRRYADPEAALYVKVPVLLSWFLGFYIIAILPIDIYIVGFCLTRLFNSSCVVCLSRP